MLLPQVTIVPISSPILTNFLIIVINKYRCRSDPYPFLANLNKSSIIINLKLPIKINERFQQFDFTNFDFVKKYCLYISNRFCDQCLKILI